MAAFCCVKSTVVSAPVSQRSILSGWVAVTEAVSSKSKGISKSQNSLVLIFWTLIIIVSLPALW